MAVTTDTTDTPKSDTPPRRRRRAGSPPSTDPGVESQATGGEGTSAGAPSPPTRKPPRSGTLEAKLNDWIATIAMGYAMVGDTWAAEFVNQRGPGLAKAWADLAKENRAVARVLERMMQGTAWGAVIFSSASFSIPLLAHHGVLPLTIDPFDNGAPIPVRGQRPMPGWSDPGQRRTIIPEPPAMPGDMTPPISPDSPPGVFTVAGSNNGATMPPGAE